MKLNWAERLAVNNPLRVLQQRMEVHWMRRCAPLRPGVEVLEIGCGRGAGARVILDEFGMERIHGSDLDIRMIRNARAYLAQTDLGRISLHVADVSALPFGDATIDAVFGFGVLHHVTDWRKALGEIARVLRPGGVYYLEELYPALYQNFMTARILLHPRENRFRSADLRLALREARLSLMRALELRRLGILGICTKREPC